MFIFCSFLILSYLFVYPLLTKGFVVSGDDVFYHLDRVIEISRNIKHGIFLPFVYTYSFGQLAFPLGIFYPEVSLIPSAILYNLFNHQVTGIYAGIAFYALLTLLFTYWVFRKLNRTWYISYFAAITYTFSTYHVIDAFARFAMGEYLAMTFLPLCLYGFYAILVGKFKDWPYLAFGLSFILLSHVLSAFIAILVMAILWLFSLIQSSSSFKKIKYFIIAGITTFVSTTIFLVPFLEQQLFQKYNQPTPKDMEQTSYKLSELLLSATDNRMTMPYSIGLVMLIILILGALYFSKLSKLEKQCYLIATIIFVSASAVFPWSIIQKTPISVIQYSYRLLAISTLLFTVVGSGLLDLLVKSKHLKSSTKQITFVFIIIAVIGTWYASIRKLGADPHLNSPSRILTNSGPQSKQPNRTLYVEQYTPKKTMPYFNEVVSHVAVINHKKVTLTKIIAKPSKQIFTDKSVQQATKVDLPVSYYKNFVAYRNGKQVSVTRSKRNTLLVSSKTTGAITIGYKYSVIDKISVIMSVLSWFGFLIYFCAEGFRYAQKFWSKQTSTSK